MHMDVAREVAPDEDQVERRLAMRGVELRVQLAVAFEPDVQARGSAARSAPVSSRNRKPEAVSESPFAVSPPLSAP